MHPQKEIFGVRDPELGLKLGRLKMLLRKLNGTGRKINPGK